MGDNMFAAYMQYYNNTEEGKRRLEERRRAEEKARIEAQKRAEKEKQEFLKKYGHRMHETVTVRGHCAYGAMSITMTLREALEKGVSLDRIKFNDKDERDDR